ncbi:MAG TPA: hypothetical protein VGV89_05725 [Thermoplasmata archaeon]|nr:hypothetical protein [Thermoplasmata archaeon]
MARFGGLAATLLALGAAALFLVPTSLGATVTLKAPYKAAIVTFKNPMSQSGCGSGTSIVPAFFNKTLGVGGMSSNGSTRWCTSSSNNSAFVEGLFQVSLPIHIRTSGAHTINATWITIARGSVNLTAGTCTQGTSMYSSCTRGARAFVYGSAYLLDKTTHKRAAPTINWPGNFTYVSNYTSCYLGSCTSMASKHSSGSFGGTFPWLWSWSGLVLNSTHKYALVMDIFGGTYVYLMNSGATFSGASANAQLNSATAGNEEQLYSVTVR